MDKPNKLLFLMLEDLIRYDKDTKEIKDYYADAVYIKTIKQAIKDDFGLCILVNTSNTANTFYSDLEFGLLMNVMKADIRVKLKKYSMPIDIIKGEDDSKRFPNPYYIYKLAMDKDIILKDSILIGNDISAMELAYNAGIGTYIESKELYEAQR